MNSLRIVHFSARVALVLLAAMPCESSADTVASLLGNFTTNQYCGLRLEENVASVHYAVVFGQLPALRELHAADVGGDGDGVTSQQERDAYVERLALDFADQLKLTVDDRPVALKLARHTSSLPTEQGGFSLRLDLDFSGDLPATLAHGEHHIRLSNQNYSGRFGWQEISVQSAPSIKIYDTDAFSTSLTEGLTQSLAVMPPDGPLSERSVTMSATRDAVPVDARLIQARPGVSASSNATAHPRYDTSEGAWLQRETRRLIALVSSPDVTLQVELLALLAALLLGALHAFSPGHGKTVVGAYLIGSRATARHAIFLGVTVTATHTLGVFALGFATLFASRFIVPERLLPILSLLSGLLVLGMGLILLLQRGQSAFETVRRQADSPTPERASIRTFRPLARSLATGRREQRFVIAYAARGHGHAGMHSHGGRMHSHLPPGATGESITWRSLLALGISGGLVPCPSAMVLLLAAVALNKTLYGLLLVVAFSAGLALTLVCIGLAFLHLRDRIPRFKYGARWSRLVPVLSAAAITILGALLCYGALGSASL